MNQTRSLGPSTGWSSIGGAENKAQPHRGNQASNINFDSIAHQALTRIESLLAEWLPDGKREGREYTACNPTRADNRPGSFKVNLDTGQWADFATSDKGGDLISLYAYLNRLSNADAARLLAQRAGLDAAPKVALVSRETWTPITPLPDNAPPPPSAHPKHGKPSARWTYHDASGKPICHVCRFDAPDGKSFVPLTYCESSKGGRAWRWQAPPEPRSLYNLHLLARRPDAPVVLSEGEKAADAAAILLPDCVATTTMNGAQSPAKADWTPLQGRSVWTWADNDEAGRQYAAPLPPFCRKLAPRKSGLSIWPLLGTRSTLRLSAKQAATPPTW